MVQFEEVLKVIETLVVLNMSKDRDGETTVIRNEISTPHSLHNINLLKQQVYVKSICSTEFLL